MIAHRVRAVGFCFAPPTCKTIYSGGLSRLRQRLRPSSFGDARCTLTIRIAGNSPHQRSCILHRQKRCKMYAYHDNRARWARTSRFAILPRPHTDGGSKLCHSRSGAAPHLFSTFHLIPLDRCVTLGLLASQLVRPARSAPEPPPKTTFCVNKTAGQGLFFYAGLRNTEHRGVCRSTPPCFSSQSHPWSADRKL